MFIGQEKHFSVNTQIHNEIFSSLDSSRSFIFLWAFSLRTNRFDLLTWYQSLDPGKSAHQLSSDPNLEVFQWDFSDEVRWLLVIPFFGLSPDFLVVSSFFSVILIEVVLVVVFAILTVWSGLNLFVDSQGRLLPVLRVLVAVSHFSSFILWFVLVIMSTTVDPSGSTATSYTVRTILTHVTLYIFILMMCWVLLLSHVFLMGLGLVVGAWPFC